MCDVDAWLAGSGAAICQREQRRRQAEMMWICSCSCAILFSKKQSDKMKFIGGDLFDKKKI